MKILNIIALVMAISTHFGNSYIYAGEKSYSHYHLHQIQRKKFNRLTIPDEPKYIDIHAHVACMDEIINGCYVNPRLKKKKKFKLYLNSLGVNPFKKLGPSDDFRSLKRLEERIKNSKFLKAAVILALDGVIAADGMSIDRVKTEVYVPNSFVEFATKQSKHFLFGASVNPNRKNALELLEDVKKKGAVLIKWIPSTMNFDPLNEKFIPFYKKMKELNLILLSHTSTEKTFSGAVDDLADPLRLELALKHGVTVIAAHSATKGASKGQLNFTRFLRLVHKYPNLFGDISALTQINRLGALPMVLRRPELKGRLFYGSDWPLHFFPLVHPSYFLFKIGPAAVKHILEFKNEWDRDFLIKKYMGTPEEVFTGVENLLTNPYFWEKK